MSTLAYFRVASRPRLRLAPSPLKLRLSSLTFVWPWSVREERHLRYTCCLVWHTVVQILPSKLLEDLMQSSLTATPVWSSVDPDDIFGPELEGDLNPLDLGGSATLDLLLSSRQWGRAAVTHASLCVACVIRYAR